MIGGQRKENLFYHSVTSKDAFCLTWCNWRQLKQSSYHAAAGGAWCFRLHHDHVWRRIQANMHTQLHFNMNTLTLAHVSVWKRHRLLRIFFSLLINTEDLKSKNQDVITVQTFSYSIVLHFQRCKSDWTVHCPITANLNVRSEDMWIQVNIIRDRFCFKIQCGSVQRQTPPRPKMVLSKSYLCVSAQMFVYAAQGIYIFWVFWLCVCCCVFNCVCCPSESLFLFCFFPLNKGHRLHTLMT